jgi:hypothetical protein
MWSRGPTARLRAALGELADRVSDGAAAQALSPQVDDHRTGAPLETDLGDAAVFLGKIGERACLVEGKAHRLFDVQVLPLLEAPGPHIVHQVRLPDGVDGMGRDLLDHLAVVGVAPVNAVPVRCLPQALGVQVADGGELDIGKGGERWEVDRVRHGPGPNHRNTHVVCLRQPATLLITLSLCRCDLPDLPAWQSVSQSQEHLDSAALGKQWSEASDTSRQPN